MRYIDGWVVPLWGEMVDPPLPCRSRVQLMAVATYAGFLTATFIDGAMLHNFRRHVGEARHEHVGAGGTNAYPTQAHHAQGVLDPVVLVVGVVESRIFDTRRSPGALASRRWFPILCLVAGRWVSNPWRLLISNGF